MPKEDLSRKMESEKKKARELKEGEKAIILIPDPSKKNSKVCDFPVEAVRKEMFTDMDGKTWVGWQTDFPFATHWTFPDTEVQPV